MELLTQEDLERWTGYQRRADIARWLEARRIPYETGAGGRILTTLEQIKVRFRREESAEEFDFG